MSEISTERVWDDFGERLRRFIASRVREPHAAADVLQETFARVHEKLGTIRDDERIGAWVFQVARNAIADHFRASDRRPSVLSSEPATELDEARLDDEVASWFPSMIDDLPETYREAVRLFELHGRSQSDIAAELSLSLTNTKSRVRRGRALLKDALLACCSFELDRRGGVLDYQPNQGGCDACRSDDQSGC